MSDNTNIVKQWAKNMLEDADKAILELDKISGTPSSISNVRGYVSEVKGCCEAIIAAMSAMEDHRCPTCKHWRKTLTDFPCNGCKFRSFNMNDKWEVKHD